MPRLIDTHCHVQFAAYREDGARVVRDALAEDVWMIAVGTQSSTSENAVSMAESESEGLYAAIGLHPNHLHVMHFDEDELAVHTRSERFDETRYAKLAASPKVVAVGEIGIDLYRLPPELDKEEVLRLQKEQFGLQLEFADKHDLPTIVHGRDAHAEILDVMKSRLAVGGLKKRGVVHSFTGTWDEAKAYLDLGFMIGFNGIISFPPRKADPAPHLALLEAAKNVPDDMFLLETDAPYLSPVPRRGEKNLPQYVKHVAERMAELRGRSYEDVAEMSVRNALWLFNRMSR
jgi:TatD DNase family protein